MRYSPRSSVTALRLRSMRIGLVASTVTPGSTAPDVSVTTPEIVAALVPCAEVGVTDRMTRAAARKPTHAERYIENLPPQKRVAEAGPPSGIRSLNVGPYASAYLKSMPIARQSQTSSGVGNRHPVCFLIQTRQAVKPAPSTIMPPTRAPPLSALAREQDHWLPQ